MFAKTIEKWEKELIQTGIKEGREEGIEKKEFEIIIRMYQKEHTPEQINDLTNIPVDKIKQIIKKAQH